MTVAPSVGPSTLPTPRVTPTFESSPVPLPESTLTYGADAGLALVLPSSWVEQRPHEALVLTQGFFWAMREDAGASSEVSGHFWRTTERGAGAALVDFVARVVAGAPDAQIQTRYADMPIGRVAVAESSSGEGTLLLYAFVDPRVAETCPTHDGGYFLRFGFPAATWTPAAARAEGDAIVRSAALTPFDEGYVDAMTDVFLCPVEPSPVPGPS